MRKILCAGLMIGFFGASVFAQKQKPWTEWSKKEAEKTLNESPWGQTQTETDTSQMTYSPTVTSTTASRKEDKNITSASNTESGATNSPMSIKYRIRFLSAKPVREAFARMVTLMQQDKPNEALSAQLQSFVDRDFADYIVVAVSVEGTDRRYLGPAMQALSSATADTLKNNVYLERKDGKRLFLMDYRAPSPDGMGAKFVFSRTVDGQPFLKTENDTVRFAAELNEKMKLNMRYKVSEMMYEGKLEY
jgi:hypothetical protein